MLTFVAHLLMSFHLFDQVKHILDQGRCKTLQEGDILVRIAGKEVRDMDHLLVVDVLKSCAIGSPTEIVVQRGGELQYICFHCLWLGLLKIPAPSLSYQI